MYHALETFKSSDESTPLFILIHSTVFSVEMSTTIQAHNTRLALEFLRLIIPHQPETHLACDKEHIYILKERIKDAAPLSYDGTINPHKYEELGRILLTTLYLNGIISTEHYKMDSAHHLYACEGTFFTDSKIEAEDIIKIALSWIDAQEHLAPYKRDIIRGIQEAILKIALIPGKFIKHFVDAYIPTSMKKSTYVDFLSQHRNILREQAFSTLFFYESTPGLHFLASRLCKDISALLVNRSTFVVPKHKQSEINDAITKNQKQLSEEYPHILSQKPEDPRVCASQKTKISAAAVKPSHSSVPDAAAMPHSRRISSPIKEIGIGYMQHRRHVCLFAPADTTPKDALPPHPLKHNHTMFSPLKEMRLSPDIETTMMASPDGVSLVHSDSSPSPEHI